MEVIMKNRNIIIVIAGIASVLFICIGFYMMNYTKLDNREILLLEYGDTFPTDHLYNADDSTYIPDNRYYIYVYLSKHCGSCLENFSSISKLFKIYQTPELTIKIIWEEETPPMRVLEKYEISTESSLFMDKSVKLSSSVPKYYIVDDNNNVVFVDNTIKKIVEKIQSLDIVDDNTLFTNAADYIVSSYVKQSGGDTIIYFTMEGCKDCQFADTIIENIAKEHPFELIRIYSYHTEDPQRICDKDAIFLNALGIDWYPSFLILTESGQSFIGRTEEDELESCIIDAFGK